MGAHTTVKAHQWVSAFQVLKATILVLGIILWADLNNCKQVNAAF